MSDTEAKLRELLSLALYTLNEIPNTRIRHEKYRNSYEAIAAIEADLRLFPPQAQRDAT